MDSVSKVEWIPRSTCPYATTLPQSTAATATHALRCVATVDDAFTGKRFDILYCTDCDAAFTSPYPSEATVGCLYEDRGYAGQGVDVFDPMRGTVVDRVKDLLAVHELRWIAGARGGPAVRSLLDYGTGNGRYALAAARTFEGCLVDAVDFHAQAPSALRS